MKILVTGASGFVGRNLLAALPREWAVTATPAERALVFDPSTAQRLTHRRLGPGHQPVAELVARAGTQSVHGDEQDPVVGPQVQHRWLDPGVGQELLEVFRIRHASSARPPSPTQVTCG